MEDQIAIVGIGCKFPGADNIDEFWRLLKNGENHMVEIPDDRWSLSAYYDADKDRPGKTFVRKAGLVKNFKDFDNQLYGINDIEAARMDPQQRFVLDCVHMAMEDGGITRKQLNGSDTGVYIGSMTIDYRDSVVMDINDINNYSVTGVDASILSARVSYVFNLLGPSIVVNTACSSALVAIHNACQAILLGDCSLAVAGGVNCILGHATFIALGKARMLGPTGQCQSFSDMADGYARGEGCGIVLLKRYSQALADGNKIWGLIRTACNQDGRTATPITAPSSDQQMALLEKIYEQTSTDPKRIQYIEAHGTGTPVGDPIETNTLGKFFMKARSIPGKNNTVRRSDEPLRVGSVKSNIGHTESAAGVAGLIKVLLMMRHGQYVPSLLCDRPNPKIEFDKYRLKVAQDTSEWPASKGGERMACVNCFGFGGTNSHAIVTQHQIEENKSQAVTTPPKKKQIVAISAGSKKALIGTLENCIRSLQPNDSTQSLESLSYTSTCRRDHFEFREAFNVQTTDELVKEMGKRLKNKTTIGSVNMTQKPRVIFVFCGVGTVWINMCREMIEKEPVFLQGMEEADNLLQPLVGYSVLKKLAAGEDVVSSPFLSHLSIFLCQVGLFTLWSHYGIKPDVIVGQSIGEVAASYAAGILSLYEAVLVIFHRSRLLGEITGGKMIVAIDCPIAVCEEMCRSTQHGRANIAVYTSPTECTLTGDESAIREIQDNIWNRNKGLDIQTVIRPVKNVQCAYHSHHVEICKDQIQGLLSTLKGSPPKTKLISTVTAKEAATGDFVTGEYWGRNILSSVLLFQALDAAMEPDTFNVFVEIGPHPVLRSQYKGILATNNGIWVASMMANSELDCIRPSLCRLYEAGVDPCWENIVNPTTEITSQPKYQFDSKTFLHEAAAWKLDRLGIKTESGHRFMRRIPGSGYEFKAYINPTTMPLLYQHKVSNTPITPGALYTEIGLEVAKCLCNCEKYNIEISTEIKQPLNLSRNKEYELYIVAEREEMFAEQGSLSFKVYAESLLASGVAHFRPESAGEERIDIGNVGAPGEHKRSLSKADVYGKLEKLGFQYGEDLQVLHATVSSTSRCVSVMELTDAIVAEMSDTNFHPSIIDGFIQSPGLLLESDKWADTTVLPVGIKSLTLKQPLQRRMVAYTTRIKMSDTIAHFRMLLLTPGGTVIAEIQNYVLRNLLEDTNTIIPSSLALDVSWKPVDYDESAAATNSRQSNPKKKILVLSNNSSKPRDMKDVLDEFDVVTEVINKGSSIAEVSRHLDVLSNRKLSSVIFVPGDKYTGREFTAEEVMNVVNSSCITLLALLNELYKRALDIPLYVVTENINQSKNGQSNNIFGSELFGFVRTVWRESMYNNTILVDVSPSVNDKQVIEKLRTILDGRGPDYKKERIELKVNQTGIYRRRIQNKSALVAVSDFRQINANHNLNLELMSTREDELKDVFWKVKVSFSAIETNGGSVDTVTVGIDKVYFPKQPIIPLTDIRVNEDGLDFLKDGQNGYNVSCLELSGHILHADGQRSGLKADDMGEPKRKVISCFPVYVANEATIPRSCMCYEDDLPGYVPGLLTTATIYWALAENVAKGSNVAVLHHGETPFLSQILVQILTTERSCTVSLLDGRISSNHVSYDVLIPMYQTWEYPDDIKSRNHLKTTDVVLVPELCGLDKQTTRRFRKSFAFTKLRTISTEDIFAPANLINTVPSMLNWLKNTNGNVNIATDNKLKDVLFKIMEVRETSKDWSPAVQVDDNNLFHRSGCYILIGGLTGLGWETLQWMAQKGAGVIVAFSRRGPDAEKQKLVSQLMTQRDCLIFHVKADISNMGNLDAALEQIRARTSHPVRGIFHGGGRVDNTLAINATEDLLRDVLLPKVAGTWNLHLWSIKNNFPLDYFVMHSSLSSFLGNAGQTAYSAANAFMDAFAFFRRSHGYCGQSINWGALDIGMMLETLEDKTVAKRFAADDMRLLSIEEVKSCFFDALLTNLPQSAYVKYGAQRNKAGKEETPKETSDEQELKRKVTSFSVNTLVHESKENVLKEVEALVIGICSEVFALPEERITIEMDFRGLGLDSMLGMTFIHRIFELTNLRIPVVALLSDGATLKSTVEYIIYELQRGDGANA